MSKHTPGPWELVRFDATDLPGIDAGTGAEQISIVMFGSIDEANTGMDDGGIRGRSKEERDANARLIAAAPMMLEVCATLRAWKEHMDTCTECGYPETCEVEAQIFGTLMALNDRALLATLPPEEAQR